MSMSDPEALILAAMEAESDDEAEELLLLAAETEEGAE